MSGKQNSLWKSLKEIFLGKGEPEVKIRSFDIIGSRGKAVATVDIPESFKGDAKEIAEYIIQKNKNVKSVLRKVSKRKGELRLREYELIAGNKNTEVMHKEYGCLFKLDPQKVYFSPREATERQRIAEQVKGGETVMVMFSGAGPFAIQIAKKKPKVKKIIAVEINPDGVEYAIENIKINKIEKGKIMPVLGDVKDVCPRFYGTCDRVVMPLPLEAEKFLNIAIKCLKKEGGVVHFYSWGPEESPYSNAAKAIDKEAEKLDRNYEIINERKVLPYAPRTYKICIDFKIS